MLLLGCCPAINWPYSVAYFVPGEARGRRGLGTHQDEQRGRPVEVQGRNRPPNKAS